MLRRQIGLARELNMPIVIHNRDAHEDIVSILREEKASEVGGVMHSFSGSWETAKMCLDMGFHISFGADYVQECEAAQRGFGKGSA